ncbi:hypothetical protein AA0115_g11922 [Alternaria tenuissima]|uniref:Uncharacterized protein n=1 Tax=Alternaria tenuissima TaxID=119927 RepID=A0AB37W4Y4_9PLEO|nr:hypothetical protein AA0115_g11922 [Alternaria tenuissima]
MPPKKKIADEGAKAGGDGKFSWTADNERTSPKKRTVATEKSDEGGDAKAESPTKKPRARKPKKETAKKEIKVEDMADSREMEDEGV